MSQSTVSRILDRYERWIAHGGPAKSGSPSHDERVRASRWLTYERNEWILTSALRIAGEMERALDTSKSTVSHPASHPSRETEVRTEHKVIDRSGIAARFLRLAHRVNMDQLKLVERDPLPALGPMTFDDVANDGLDHEPRAEQPAPAGQELAIQATTQDQGPAQQPGPASIPIVHSHERPESSATSDVAPTCAENSTLEKSTSHAYAVANTPPEMAGQPCSVLDLAECIGPQGPQTTDRGLPV